MRHRDRFRRRRRALCRNAPFGAAAPARPDCSALVQLADGCGEHRAARHRLQEKLLGVPVEGGVAGSLARGDLVFWKGHVGILADAARMVHASGYAMTVVVEPLADAVARIGPPTSLRRIPA
jgi:cell wall-associated NlpC family hydrolase